MMTAGAKIILGIETSCDETAAAVVRDGGEILSSVVASSLPEHQRFGGIIPEIASRRQLESIDPVVTAALGQAGIGPADIAALAVTRSPGLIGSLLVGLSYARALSLAWSKPLLEMDHVRAHLYANFLYPTGKTDFSPPGLPAIGLIVSGGHTSLYHIKDLGHFQLLGQTRDDAAGEAFDKVARILDLGYPGGPVIDRLAQAGRNDRVTFPSAEMGESLDFSFSGVKTAVLYYVRRQAEHPDIGKEQIAFAFQESVVRVLVKKSLAACARYRVKTLMVGGGVAANSRLRECLLSSAGAQGIKVFFPALPLCMDNAAMIAGLACQQLKK